MGRKTSAVNRGFVGLQFTLCSLSPIWGKEVAAVNRSFTIDSTVPWFGGVLYNTNRVVGSSINALV